MTVPDPSSCFGNLTSFPPGFRFHPTDEELVLYYLKRKICRRRLKLDIVAETDVYKWDPEDLPGLSKLRTGDRQWFFFSPRERKYPNKGRSNRATIHGYWKATGKDRTISCNTRSVGIKKTLVYYKGRAPSGERTDWVMHEYTLDEDALKSCPSEYDSYALYKLYKKSGAGPKNGEQYGAPFKEEDWSDDELVNFDGVSDQINILKEANVSCVDNDKTHAQPQCSLDDLEELLNQIADEPVFDSPLNGDYTYTLDQLLGEEENLSMLPEQPSGEVNLPDRGVVLHHSHQQYNVSGGFESTQYTTAHLQQYKSSEVTSAPKIGGLEVSENFFEDFLEMDDLIGPKPTVGNAEKPPEALTFDGIDGLIDYDLYNDAAMFLPIMGPSQQGQHSEQYFNNLEKGMENVASNLNVNNIENEAVNYRMESSLNDANQKFSHQYTQDQSLRMFTPAEAYQSSVSQPISGVICNDNPANLSAGATLNQSGREGTDSWLISALWAFVESIPTTPASASETALVNRTFEQMSTFGRFRVNTGKSNSSTGNLAASSRSSGSFKVGVFCFSIFGIFCALLWVLIGTSVELVGRCASS